MMTRKISIIEDNDALRRAVVDMLERAGFRAKGFLDGQDFLNQLPQTTSDLIVSDVQMPHVGGLEALQSTGYFARPYTSWERGTNENFNGLLRQYVSKKRSMATVTEEGITMIENRLNNRPRKRLGFKTPAEVFHQSLKRVALRA